MTNETPIAAFKRLVDEYHATKTAEDARVLAAVSTTTVDDDDDDEPMYDMDGTYFHSERPDFDTRDREGRDELPVLDGEILTDEGGGN